MLGQLRELATTADAFRAHRTEFLQGMFRAAGRVVPWPEDVFNPYPIALSSESVARLMALG
ncbi:MAG TPA: hypothetical protein VF608_12610, partial [Thermoanaerobaculia bacterium]